MPVTILSRLPLFWLSAECIVLIMDTQSMMGKMIGYIFHLCSPTSSVHDQQFGKVPTNYDAATSMELQDLIDHLLAPRTHSIITKAKYFLKKYFSEDCIFFHFLYVYREQPASS